MDVLLQVMDLFLGCSGVFVAKPCSRVRGRGLRLGPCDGRSEQCRARDCSPSSSPLAARCMLPLTWLKGDLILLCSQAPYTRD